MDTVCRGLEVVFVCLNDILIFICSEKEHLQHLRQLFQQSREYHLLISLEKCRFGVYKIAFLG